jgi:hypothetical protein
MLRPARPAPITAAALCAARPKWRYRTLRAIPLLDERERDLSSMCRDDCQRQRTELAVTAADRALLQPAGQPAVAAVPGWPATQSLVRKLIAAIEAINRPLNTQGHC